MGTALAGRVRRGRASAGRGVPAARRRLEPHPSLQPRLHALLHLRRPVRVGRGRALARRVPPGRRRADRAQPVAAPDPERRRAAACARTCRSSPRTRARAGRRSSWARTARCSRSSGWRCSRTPASPASPSASTRSSTRATTCSAPADTRSSARSRRSPGCASSGSTSSCRRPRPRATRPRSPRSSTGPRPQGAVCFNLYFLVPTGRGSELAELPAARVEELLGVLVDAERQHRGAMMVRAKCAPHFMRRVHEATPDSPVLSYRTRCPCGIDYCRITPDGKLTPCPYMPSVAGDLRRQSFAEIWHGSELLASLRRRELHGRCGRCEYRLVCGGCRARALATTGDVLAEDPACVYEPPPGRALVARPRGGVRRGPGRHRALVEPRRARAAVADPVVRARRRHEEDRGVRPRARARRRHARAARRRSGGRCRSTSRSVGPSSWAATERWVAGSADLAPDCPTVADHGACRSSPSPRRRSPWPPRCSIHRRRPRRSRTRCAGCTAPSSAPRSAGGAGPSCAWPTAARCRASRPIATTHCSCRPRAACSRAAAATTRRSAPGCSAAPTRARRPARGPSCSRRCGTGTRGSPSRRPSRCLPPPPTRPCATPFRGWPGTRRPRTSGRQRRGRRDG